MTPRFTYLVSTVLAASLLAGCGAVSRLGQVGKAPKLSEAEEAIAPRIEGSIGRSTGGERTQDGGDPEASVESRGASLFRTGSGAFFRDQRASRVGDIVTIRIKIADNANVNNTTTRTRGGSESASIASLLGLEKKINPSVDTDSSSQSSGMGRTVRSEQINMTMAATVTSVLPNGNLSIRGKQEVRVNFELRELVVAGIIRPEDIARDNSINHNQIAEARISYGGRGQLTEAQQARWGQQIYDALFPF